MPFDVFNRKMENRAWNEVNQLKLVGENPSQKDQIRQDDYPLITPYNIATTIICYCPNLQHVPLSISSCLIALSRRTKKHEPAPSIFFAGFSSFWFWICYLPNKNHRASISWNFWFRRYYQSYNLLYINLPIILID